MKLSLPDRSAAESRTRSAQARVLAGVLAGSLLALAAYLRMYRPWQLRWVAMDQEVWLPMPGDEMVPRPTSNATRAVTIAARPQEIWPWLLQIGAGRGGWYTYDWLEGHRDWLEGHRSAERIIPEFQRLAVGDQVPTSANGTHGPWVWALEPNRWMLWGDTEEAIYTWYWGLYPLYGGTRWPHDRRVSGGRRSRRCPGGAGRRRHRRPGQPVSGTRVRVQRAAYRTVFLRRGDRYRLQRRLRALLIGNPRPGTAS